MSLVDLLRVEAVDRDVSAALDHPMFVSQFDLIIANAERARRLECRSPPETLPVYDCYMAALATTY